MLLEAFRRQGSSGPSIRSGPHILHIKRDPIEHETFNHCALPTPTGNLGYTIREFPSSATVDMK